VHQLASRGRTSKPLAQPRKTQKAFIAYPERVRGQPWPAVPSNARVSVGAVADIIASIPASGSVPFWQESVMKRSTRNLPPLV
jgi:hypothetical protein